MVSQRLLILLFAAFALAGCNSDNPNESASTRDTSQSVKENIDLEPFKKLAHESSCADVNNRLFLIDNRFVFWDRDSKCADAAYSRTLYDRKPETVLCNLMDSIAGPQRGCHGDAPSANMFDTIVDNRDKPDLGLGPEHTVAPITF